MKRMLSMLGALSGMVMFAAGCGGGSEPKPAAENLGRAASALCSPVGSYNVLLSGEQQDSPAPTYTCTGKKPYSQTVNVNVTHDDVKDVWVVKFMSLTQEFSTYPIVLNYAAATTTNAAKIGCPYSGTLQITIDDDNVTVTRNCKIGLAGIPTCQRYYNGTGSVARMCAPAPDAGAPDAADDGDAEPAPSDDAGTDADAASAADASSSPDGASSSSGSSAPPATDPPQGSAPPASTSGNAADPQPPTAAPADEPPAASSCATNGGSGSSRASGLGSLFVIALAIGLVRRRHAQA